MLVWTCRRKRLFLLAFLVDTGHIWWRLDTGLRTSSVTVSVLGPRFGPYMTFSSVQFSSVQSLSHVRLFATPWTTSTPGFSDHHQLPESTQIHVHWVGDAIQPSHPLWPPSPPALSLSQHQGLLNESALHIRWPKYCRLRFNISPTNEHPGLISFRMDWLDFLAVQGTLKSLLQHHGSKPSIIWRSAFFTVQLEHPYMLLLLSRFSRIRLCATP